ncbi:MAG: outer membrane lipoprotein-sorting protein [Balneolales bacterium]|nr:outer membrane lipoprotein-sorting protein [Balneolales bacterium]
MHLRQNFSQTLLGNGQLFHSAGSLLMGLVFLVLLLTTSAIPAIAQQDVDEEEARRVYEELDRRLGSVVYETATLNMRIVDNRGRVRERNLDLWSFSEGEERRSLVRFNAPADVRGTGLLTINDGTNEIQRLFLPSLNRIQSISGAQRGDRFMGSDFTFEDLGNQDPDAFEFSTLTHDREANRMTVRGDRTTPASYAWAEFEIDTERYILLKATYFDENGNAIRELTAENITEVREDIWRANQLTMRDLRAERYTVLEWTSRTIDEPINRNVFTERYLQRN